MLTTWKCLYCFWNMKNVLDFTLLFATYIFIKLSKNCSSNTHCFMILRNCYEIKLCPGFISVINQNDAQHFCFTKSLFHASKCFEHMCSSWRGQNCITQPLVSSHQFWPPHDEDMCSKYVEAWNKLIVKQKFCASCWLITEINILRCTFSKTSKNVSWMSISRPLHTLVTVSCRANNFMTRL